MPQAIDSYKEGIDFAELALQFPEFNKHLKKNGQLDFSDPKAVKELTYSLLKRDFKINLELPDDRLCPPVPNRLNYVLWVQSLIDTSSTSYQDTYSPPRVVTGLDIGTGASCIYPLLACSQRPKWLFKATELDMKNFKFANANVQSNGLGNRIEVVSAQANGPLIPLDRLGVERIDFTMCNPPFYESPNEMMDSAKAKFRPPQSSCTGAEIEMVTTGGETAFVGRMIAESKVLKDRVQWYSSMLGKLSSVDTIVEQLRKEGVNNWAVSEFVQGGKTKRWGVAWSWVGMRPSVKAARGTGSLPKQSLPFPSEFHFIVDDAKADTIAGTVNDIVDELDLRWQFRPEMLAGVGFAGKNVWSRSARRNKGQKQGKTADPDAMDEDDDENEEPMLGFRINVLQGDHKEGAIVKIRWLQGMDHVLFESFCGMIKRAVSNR